MKIWEIDLSKYGTRYTDGKGQIWQVSASGLRRVYRDGSVSVSISDYYSLEQILQMNYHEYITNQVTWQEAIEAWANGCDVEWILNNLRCFYDGDNEYFWDHDEESLFKQQIVEGKWRIVEDEDMKKMQKIWEGKDENK